jgi:IclR family acetate operon transcriptional repressor
MAGRTDGVQSVDRAFAILEAMADADGEVGLSELSEKLELPVPTLHRMLRTLMAGGYARQLASRRYALGPRLITLGESAARLTGSGVRPILADLSAALGETANMAIRDRDEVIYVAQVQSRQTSMRVFTEVGRRVSLHSTGVGKAIMANLSESEVRAIVGRTGLDARTAHTFTKLDQLLAELAAIRARGYAVDEEEQELGVRCFAAAIPQAPVSAAISVSGPEARMTDAVKERAVPLLQAAAQLVAAGLAK